MLFRAIVVRILSLPLVLFGISLVVFALARLIPGNPVINLLGSHYTPEAANQLSAELGLNHPIYYQYILWIGKSLTGDFGYSYFYNEPVLPLVIDRLPLTIVLALMAFAFAVIFGVLSGAVAALRPGSVIDHSVRLASLFGVSAPVYITGLLLLAVFAVQLRIARIGGSLQDGGVPVLILPAIALGLTFVGIVSRTTYTTMRTELESGYIRAARARGLPEYRVLIAHAIRNTLPSVATVSGLQLGYALGGAVITETIFGLPGVGNLLVTSISNRDYPVLQGCVLVIAVCFVIVNLLTDLFRMVLDPRIASGA